MKIFFCDLCNESVPQGDLDQGRAFLRKGRVVCATCDRLMTGEASGGPFEGGGGGAGAVAEGGGTATLVRPETARAVAAFGRPDPAPRSSSTGAWLAIVTLVFAAAAFALLVERITALETTMLQEDAKIAGDVRGMSEELDAAVAGVGDRSLQFELRTADRIDAVGQRADETVQGLAGELASARTEIGQLEQTVKRLTDELAQARADAVRRNDDVAGRVARAEEDLRYYSQRLSDLEMAALRPIATPGGAGDAGDGAMGAGGVPAWQGLVQDLASPLAGTRWQAVDALGEVDDPAVIEHLIPVLRDPDVFVRMAGARALMKRGAVQATPALIDALEDPEAAVREAAFVALNELTGRDFRFDPLANDADRAKRVKAWREWWEKEGSGGE